MSDIVIQLNSVAWEVGHGSPNEDPFIYGVTVTTRGRLIQLGSMRLSDLNAHLWRVLKKSPPTPSLQVGTPAQAESPGDEVQKGKP